LHKFCKQHGVFATGNAYGNAIARLYQVVFLYTCDKRLPYGFAEFFVDAAALSVGVGLVVFSFETPF